MGKIHKDVGRVTVFPLLHTWQPATYGAVAYATTGDQSEIAAVGYLPIPDVPDVYMLDVAARHAVGGSATKEMDWVLCTAWSARAVPKPGTIDLHDAAWMLEIDARRTRDTSLYGHTELLVGRFTLEDPSLTEQAERVLDDHPSAPPELRTP
ncbi:hypothetical protein AB0A70_20870 [Streptomyces morookaense]|uniref:hypothetical protein n=1 Tax=Streptomyces morookaense TaxID=1970 RepID=UPI0033C97E69